MTTKPTQAEMEAAEKNGQHPTLTEALAAVQSEFPDVPREGSAQARGSRRYNYATLDSVLETVVPVLNRHGIALIQKTTVAGEDMLLHTILRHTSGQEVESIVPLPRPQTWQEWGSALTYARRYSLTALAGVPAGTEDDDGATAQGAPKAEAPHGICADHGVAWRQTQYGIGHPRGQGEPWCNKQPADSLGWDVPPPDGTPARMPDPKAAAQAAASAGFGAPKMPVATAQAPHGVCETHRMPWFKTQKGQFGHYFTPNPPRGDGKGEWCPRRSQAPSLAEQAAQVATERAGQAQMPIEGAARPAPIDEKEEPGYRVV